MIISPGWRLFLLIMAGILPVWKGFFVTSTDYSLRGLAIPFFDAATVAIVITIARTRNPLVDGGPMETPPVVPPPPKPDLERMTDAFKAKL